MTAMAHRMQIAGNHVPPHVAQPSPRFSATRPAETPLGLDDARAVPESVRHAVLDTLITPPT